MVGCLTKRHRLGNGLRTVWNVLVVKLLRRSHPIPKTADETTALVDTGDVHAVMIAPPVWARRLTGCTPV